jgi:electron transport complex protein RnfG
MMNKLEPKLIVVLTLVMICSATVLTYVYQETNPVIEARQARETKEAILQVMPSEAEKYEEVTKDGTAFYQGLDSNGNVVGYAVENSGQGFQSTLEVMVGLDLENNQIFDVIILNQAETPGLGARITEDQFKAQFEGKSFTDSFSTDEDIDAISGATISSQALSDVIKGAVNKVQQAYASGGE